MGDAVKKRSWGRRVFVTLLVIVVPLIVGYFVATSEPFLKGVILPRVSKALNAKVTVEKAAIHPFSQVTLSGVRVQTTGSEPLAVIKEARVRHSLTDIIRGNIKVYEVTAVSPVIHIIYNPDGTSNLDPILKSQEQKPSEKPSDQKPGKPPQLDIAQIKIENGALRKTQLVQGGGPSQTTEVSDFNLTIANVKNGGSGSLDLSGRLRGQLEGALQGKLTFALTEDLQPASVNGGAGLSIDKAAAPMQELAALAANVTCDITMAEVKQLALVFQKNQQPLGELRAYGPFSAAKQEGRLNVELLGIDRRLLGLIGARLGMDFGDTKINSTNVIELAAAGNHIKAAGGLAVSGFSITRTNQSTPKVDVHLTYGVAVDQGAKTLELEQFRLAGTQNQKPLLTADLAQPMSVSWGQTSTGLPDSGVKLAVTGFRFSDWKALLGDVPEGNLNATMEVQSRQSGRTLALKGDAQVSGLILDNPPQKPLEAKLSLDSSLREKVLELEQLAVSLTPTQLAKNEANLQGRIDLSRADAITGKLQLTSDALDLTGYYDLFAGDEKGNQPQKQPAPAGRGVPAERPDQIGAEPPRQDPLPFNNFVIDTKIGHVYLRQLHLSNVVTGIRLDRSRLDLKPIGLALNGAPVNGAVGLDLAVPDYGYDLALKMDSVPLAPIADSFMTEYRGRAKGDLTANVQIKGVGATGTTLKKTLQGEITASCTNGQIQLAGEKMRKLLDNIAGYLHIPELRTAPLTAFEANIGLGSGKIQLKKVDLISDAFIAHTEGAIQIVNVLTNSPIPKLPVTLALSRSLAEKAKLVDANSPTNTPYVPLPPFLYLTGTLGKPDTDYNKAAIAGIIARSQVLPRIGGDAGKIIDNILGGGKSTNATSTNQPTNPLDRLFKKQPK